MAVLSNLKSDDTTPNSCSEKKHNASLTVIKISLMLQLLQKIILHGDLNVNDSQAYLIQVLFVSYAREAC